MPSSVVEGEGVGRRGAGPDRRFEGASLVARRGPVVGELRPVPGLDRALGRTPGRQRLPEGAMQPLSLARQQVLVGRFLEQGVGEFP